MRTNWERWAACANDPNPARWFPVGNPASHRERPDVQEALAVCESCPVRVECLAVARRHGIWGATTEYERMTPQQRVRALQLYKQEPEPSADLVMLG